MRRQHWFAGLLSLSVCGSILSQEAGVAAGFDRLTLQNGSVVVGEIVGMSGGALSVKTAFGVDEVVKVKWAEVAAIDSSSDVTLEMADGRVVTGRFATTDGVVSFAGSPIDFAQISEINPDLRPWTLDGAINAGAAVADGNTQTKAFNLAAEAVFRRDRHRVSGRVAYNYADNSISGVTARNLRGTLKYDFFVTDRLYTYANALAEDDSFQDLNLRLALGAGLGYQFVQKGDLSGWLSGFQLEGEAGASYFDEDFKSSPDAEYIAARWAMNAVLPVNDDVEFFHRHEGYPSLEDISDLYILTEQGVRVHIWENFAATLQVNWRWDNTPSAGFERSDTLYLVTLGYIFSL